jgi:hypothetical protein
MRYIGCQREATHPWILIPLLGISGQCNSVSGNHALKLKGYEGLGGSNRESHLIFEAL